MRRPGRVAVFGEIVDKASYRCTVCNHHVNVPRDGLSLVKAILEPSSDQAGCPLAPGAPVSWVTAFPSRFITKIWRSVREPWRRRSGPARLPSIVARSPPADAEGGGMAP